MNPPEAISAQPLLGVTLHAVGALCAAFCYTPQKRVRGWSWQTYWIVQALICWLILPIVGAWFTVPHLAQVLIEAPHSVMVKAFCLGALYGVGGTAFGLTIRYLGFSLTYAIAVGISCMLGTILPPIVHGQLSAIYGKTGSGWIMAGMAIGALGIFCSGIAGRWKELDLTTGQQDAGTFSLRKGLPLCILAGILSAVYGFALDQGQPIAEVAAKFGAGIFQGNVIYIFSNSGALLTTALYCLFLTLRHRTIGEFVELPAGEESAALPLNFAMAFLTGCLWYSQFLFYGLGHVHMGSYKFTSWAIHMIMLVLFSTLAGLLFREWHGCKSRTWSMLALALLILIFAVTALTYGNYLGTPA
jgi:L-rhamnose-H+ transport protein